MKTLKTNNLKIKYIALFLKVSSINSYFFNVNC